MPSTKSKKGLETLISGSIDDSLLGLSKREFFAAMALSNVKASTPGNAATTALAIADALIAELETPGAAILARKGVEVECKSTS